MTHVVDQIADAIVDLLMDQTSANVNVTRDRPPTENFYVGELPAIDIRIGPDNPVDAQVIDAWRSEVAIYVDLYASVGAESVSKILLQLRSESYQSLMAAIPQLSAVANVISILPGGAEEVLIADQGDTAVGYLRTVFFVLHQHSLTDPDV